MSATPPFGPAYNQPPDDGQRQGSNQWQPRAGRPASGQGGQVPPGQGGQMPAAGGRPGPQAGRGPERPQPPVPPQPPQRPGGAPQSPPRPGGAPQSPPRSGQQPYPPQSPQQPPVPAPERSPEPFEEAAFADAGGPDEWGGDQGTTAIGKIGYVPKDSRSQRRSDFQKVRSRARKSSPVPKIIAAVVVLGLLAGAGWWWLNREDSDEGTEATDPNLTYAASEEPCSFVDAAPMAEYDGGEPEMSADTRDRQRGWEQLCVLNYGSAESATALLEFESTVFESDAKAEVNLDLGYGQVSDSEETWSTVESAPEVGAQSEAVSRVVDEGTSNYQLHVQDGNVYLIVRLSMVDSGLDEEGFGDLTSELAGSYLEAWRDA